MSAKRAMSAWAVAVLAAASVVAAESEFKPVAFKDAAKIKSWDAWNDHKRQTGWKEKRSVTWEKIQKMSSGLEPAGQLETRPARDIKGSNWSVGCETMDRDYAVWDNYKRFLADLGAKRGRLFSGWAKTEQVKDVYDFTWLDPQVREMSDMGVKPWICVSYGNPVWGSDFRLGMRVKQVTGNRDAFDAWLRYTKALVARYKDVVDEWEIWNEPFNQAEDYAQMVYETAKAIREVQSNAVCIVTAVHMKDYPVILEKLKRENALDLVKWWVYHPYEHNPDASYEKHALPLRKLVKSYSSDYDILQGEVGCPSQLEYAHAICFVEWTEYSQAKWDLRRAIGDAARNIPSSLFTMIDLQYTFMLQSFGLVRANALKEPVYRRPSYYAMQNVYSYFDEDVHAVGVEKQTVNGKELTIAKFTRQSAPIYVVWFSGERPNDTLAYERADLSPFIREFGKGTGVWVDLMRGKIGKLPNLTSVPVWDSPVMIALNSQVPRRTVWQEMTPAEIVDALYRPCQGCDMWRKDIKMSVTNEPWAKMPTSEFLPCFDKYGQFKWRDWPGKTHSDEELKAVTAEEEKDLAANPGPADWNQYGGWAKGPQLKATGRFRTEKVDGKWWLVDPEGRLFWSWGPVRVTPSAAMTPLNGNPRTPKCGGSMPERDCLFTDLPKKGEPLAKFYETYDDLLKPFYLKRDETRWFDFSSANLSRKYGEDWFERYSDSCHRRLRSWRCNTIANSSDLRICLQDRTPYAERVECLSRPIAGSWGGWFKFRDPFDESFKVGCKAELERHGREAHDPWCIGFFIDNEINWGAKPTDLAQWTLWSPDDQPAKIEFTRRLKEKGIDPKVDTVPETELKAFTAVLAEEYFKKTREALREFDPGLLYLGCRFAGSARPWAIRACAKYADVVSYNIYADSVGKWRLPQKLDAPVMIGEFHFGAHDRGLFGSGLINKGSQAGRAQALKAYVESALGNPQIVGAHWHQFSDQATSGRFDGEYFQVGWTDICDRPYKETVEALRSIDIYAARGAGVGVRAGASALVPKAETTAALPAKPTELDLAGEWLLSGTDEADAEIACPIAVPGGVHSALLKAGKMVDPFKGRNELKTQWVGRHAWTVTRTFDVDAATLARRAVVLRLEDVDTFATIFVNGREVGTTDNRFRRWEFDVKPFLKAGTNEIRGEFASAELTANEMAAGRDHRFPMSNVPWAKNQALIRKPACHGGWDWGLAQMVTGFCGPVKILVYDDFKVDSVVSAPSFNADMTHCDLTVTVRCTDAEGRPFAETRVFAIDNPPLWWPNGAGEQKFYTCELDVRGRKIAKRIGLRKIEVLNTPDTDENGKPGARMAFRVNGREIFMKGANWIPCSAFDNEQTPARYRDLLESAVAANMNMLRLWGGGQYEKDAFYDICDELGLLVWHDLMFSCAVYPGDETFLASVRDEFEYQFRRLRDHASIALWCGDNECIGALNWFDASRADKPYYKAALVARHDLSAKTVAACDPTRTFWPSSPCGGPGDFSDGWHNDAKGDMHNWNVWHENKGFSDYYNFRPRFCSEFGYQSFSSREVAETFCAAEDVNPTSPDFEWHQKNGGGNRRILEMMARYFRYPQGTDATLYLSQVQQALAIKTAVEGWRAQRPRCMGTLFWQLNDNWPVASWSSIEYGGKWKHLQHHARRFFAPLAIVGLPGGKVAALNDLAEAVDADIAVERWSFDGRFVSARCWQELLSPDSARTWPDRIPAAAADDNDGNTFLHLVLHTRDGVFENDWFFGPYKSYDLADPALDVRVDGFRVTLTVQKPAFFVWANAKGIRGEFDDNSITLMPGRPRTLTFRPKDDAITPEAFAKVLKVTHLRETYR